jgi:hypothetical protein
MRSSDRMARILYMRMPKKFNEVLDERLGDVTREFTAGFGCG